MIDDWLSALDFYVGQKLFEQVILNYLKNKTVVFVTNAVHFLENWNKIIFL